MMQVEALSRSLTDGERVLPVDKSLAMYCTVEAKQGLLMVAKAFISCSDLESKLSCSSPYSCSVIELAPYLLRRAIPPPWLA